DSNRNRSIARNGKTDHPQLISLTREKTHPRSSKKSSFEAPSSKVSSFCRRFLGAYLYCATYGCSAYLIQLKHWASRKPVSKRGCGARDCNCRKVSLIS